VLSRIKLADLYSKPFLALTAQLPYGASSTWKNVLSCLYAIGSPTLLLYSLTLTVVYRFWIRKEFKGLLEEHPLVPAHFRKRAKAAKYILQNCHHVPTKVLQGEDGYLSSAVVLGENTIWWQRLQHEIEQRRRPLTQSLGAQIFWVAVSQVFVWIATFQKAGDVTIGTGLSSGLMLLWMLPVVWGTYEVGNFPDSDAIKEAIANSEGKFVLAGATEAKPLPPALPQPKTAMLQRDSNSLTDYVRSVAERANSSTSTNGSRIPLSAVQPFNHLYREYQVPDRLSDNAKHAPQFLWLSIQGDEIETGATMNYARLHTSRVTASYIIDAFKSAREKMIRSKNPNGREAHGPNLETLNRFWGTRDEIARYCDRNVHPGSLAVFKDSKRPNEPPDWAIAVLAAIVALCVTWGSLGAGILVAYLTPTKGLGCFSGSILLYGVLDTVSFFLFWGAGELSWSYCHYHENKRKISIIIKFKGALAVCTRLCAKFISILAAIWEVTSTILAYSNIWGNCWCDTVYFSRRDTAYTAIFIDTSMISDESRHFWYGGLFLSLILCAAAAIFFSISRESRSDSRQVPEE